MAFCGPRGPLCLGALPLLYPAPFGLASAAQTVVGRSADADIVAPLLQVLSAFRWWPFAVPGDLASQVPGLSCLGALPLLYPAAFVLAYLLAQIPQSAGALMRAVEHHFGGMVSPFGALWVRFRGGLRYFYCWTISLTLHHSG